MISNTAITGYIEVIEKLKKGDYKPDIPAAPSYEIGQLGAALEDLAYALEARDNELQQHDRIVSSINAGLLLDDIMESVYQSFRSIIPYNRIGFALIRDNGKTVQAHWAKTDQPEIHLKRGYTAQLEGSSLQTIIETGQPRIINDLAEYLEAKPDSKSTQLLVKEGIRSSLTCPLIANNAPVGFVFFSSIYPNTYTDAHIDLYQRIAAQLSVVAEKGRFVSELADQKAAIERQHEKLQRLHALQEEYLQQVARVTKAAAELEAGEFEPASLDKVAERSDELGKLARVFQKMDREIRSRERRLIEINIASSRFVPTEFLDFLGKESIVDIHLGDHISKEMTILFSDVRSFTSLSERMTPQENFDFVNAYLKRVSPIIRDHNGFIVKYLGDGIMAIFPHTTDDAVQAAIGKLKRVAQFNAERQARGEQPIRIGIGIHIGHMMVGMVGEEDRIQADAFSDIINATARLENLTKYYNVSLIISEEAFARLSDPRRYNIRFLDRVKVKGRESPSTIYEVFDGDDPALLVRKQQALVDFEQGVEHFFRQEFIEVIACMARVLTYIPDDKATHLYLERATHWARTGTPADWDGVLIMAEK